MSPCMSVSHSSVNCTVCSQVTQTYVRASSIRGISLQQTSFTLTSVMLEDEMDPTIISSSEWSSASAHCTVTVAASGVDEFCSASRAREPRGECMSHSPMHCQQRPHACSYLRHLPHDRDEQCMSCHYILLCSIISYQACVNVIVQQWVKSTGDNAIQSCHCR